MKRKTVISFIVVLFLVMVIAIIRDVKAQQDRLQEVKDISAEIDTLNAKYKPLYSDIVRIDIADYGGHLPKPFIGIELKKGMDHRATYVLFSGKKWKSFKVDFRETVQL